MEMASPSCFVFALQLILLASLSHALPFVLLHGIGASCEDPNVVPFTKNLTEWSGSQGYCVEIGNGFWDSLSMPLMKQAAEACDKVKQINELSEGYNLVGLSQGNMVARGLIEFCDGGPPIKNYISLAGPHAGIASIPRCSVNQTGFICGILDYLHDKMESEAYTSFVQEHFAPSGFLKLPTDFDGYIKNCSFLPKVNNEYNYTKNSTYKERFESLQNLVLVMFEQESVLIPKETSWFGYYPDGASDPLLLVQQTKLYTEDWIGLKTLDEAGKVRFVNVSGDHLQISEDDMKTYVVPYLVEEQAVTGSNSGPVLKPGLITYEPKTNSKWRLGKEASNQPDKLNLNIL